jgi:hypothetical protein
MPRKSKVQLAAEAAAAAAITAADARTPDAEIDVDDEYTDVLEGLHRLTEGRSATWELHCIAPPENEGMVCKLQTSQLDMAYIKGRFPPGEYKIIGRDDRGSYIRGSHKSFKLSALGSSGAQAVDTGGGDLATTLKTYMDAQAAREREAAERRKEMMMGLLPAVTAAVGPIVAALISRPDPLASLGPILAALKPSGEHGSMKDMVETMAALQQLNGGSGNQLDVAFKVLDRIKDIPTGEGTGWVGSVLEVIKDLAPAAKEMVQQIMDRRAGVVGQPAPTNSPAVFLPGTVAAPTPPPRLNGSAPPASSAGQPAPASATTTGPTGSLTAAEPPSAASFAASAESDMFLKIVEPWLRKQADNVTDWAKNDVDPELAADLLLASVPMSFRRLVQVPTLLEWLQRADGWQLFVMFHPPIGPYQAWAEKLRGHLIIMLQEELAESGAPPADSPGAVQ